jgi:hypothetical protein
VDIWISWFFGLTYVFFIKEKKGERAESFVFGEKRARVVF